MYFKKVKILPLLTLQAKLMKKSLKYLDNFQILVAETNQDKLTSQVFRILTDHYVQGKCSFETQLSGICTHQKSPKSICSHYYLVH